MSKTVLNKVSIIIPTYNRPAYLQRLLSYFRQYELNSPIVILDSSNKKNKNINREIINSMTLLQISYQSYDPDLWLYHKLEKGIRLSNTPYTIFCPDDDFVMPSALLQAAIIMDEYPDISVVDGYYLSFWLESNSISPRHFHYRPCYIHESRMENDPLERLHSQLSYYYPTYYAFHRTDFLAMAASETLRWTNDIYFGELLPSMLAAVYGKFVHLDQIFGFREFIRGPLQRRGLPGIDGFIKDGTIDRRYSRFKECITNHLCTRFPQTSKEAASGIVDDAMNRYYNLSVLNGKCSDPKFQQIHSQIQLSIKQKQADLKELINSRDKRYYEDFIIARETIKAHGVVTYNGGCSRVMTSSIPDFLKKQAEFDSNGSVDYQVNVTY